MGLPERIVELAAQSDCLVVISRAPPNTYSRSRPYKRCPNALQRARHPANKDTVTSTAHVFFSDPCLDGPGSSWREGHNSGVACL